ncbi:MAG: esterase, partial [Polaromonas sp.]
MIKSLTSLWLKNVRRVGKAQQTQGRKLFKSLLTQSLRAPAVKRATAVKAIRPIKPLKLVKPVA